MKNTYCFTLTAILGTLCLLAAGPILAAPGDLDATFGNGGRLIGSSGFAHDVAAQADGKIVVVSASTLTRYNPDGSPDSTFGSGTGKVRIDAGAAQSYISRVFLRPDGKIVIAKMLAKPGAAYFLIARYQTDGSVDGTFGSGTGQVLTMLPCGDSGDEYGADFAMAPDGAIVGSVDFDYCLAVLIRHRSDGTVDSSFGNQGIVRPDRAEIPTFLMYDTTALSVEPGGKIVLTLGYGMYKYELNGSSDLSFGPGGSILQPGQVSHVVTQPDGKILLCGNSALARYNANGSRDTSFGVNGVAAAPMRVRDLRSIAVQTGGKILAAGTTSPDNNGNTDLALIRYDANGSLDRAFGAGEGFTTIDLAASDQASGVATDTYGRALIVGSSGGMLAMARVLGDSAAPGPVTVSGRVTGPAGQGLRNALVSMTNQFGVVRTTITSSFGNYSFENTSAGGIYTISVTSKRYKFTPLTITVNDDLTAIDLVGME